MEKIEQIAEQLKTMGSPPAIHFSIQTRMKTVSQATAKRLIEAEIILGDSFMVWDSLLFQEGNPQQSLTTRKFATEVIRMFFDNKHFQYSHIPAPTFDELFEILPVHIHKKKVMYTLSMVASPGGIYIAYWDNDDSKRFGEGILEENLAEAAALMALQLKEQKISLNIKKPKKP